MANVHVFVTNNSGHTVGLTLDANDERVEDLKKLAKREELAKVEVKAAPVEKKTAAK